MVVRLLPRICQILVIVTSAHPSAKFTLMWLRVNFTGLLIRFPWYSTEAEEQMAQRRNTPYPALFSHYRPNLSEQEAL